jgi:hypothetical protein
MDDDSVATDTASVHVDLDGTVTSVHLDLESMINSIHQIFSFLGMGESSMAYTTASSAHGLGFSLASSECLPRTCWPPLWSTGTEYQCSTRLSYHRWRGRRLMKQAKGLDPPFQHIAIGSDLRNWMPGTGASSHFTPCLLNLQEVEEGLI